MVPAMGVEPIRYHYHGILNPARLPIPPRRPNEEYYIILWPIFKYLIFKKVNLKKKSS